MIDPLKLLLVLVPLAGPADEAPTSPPAEPTVEERLDELDQRLRILDRKAEIEREAAAAQKPATVVADKSGFSLRSADGAYQVKIRGYVHVDGRFFLDDEERPGTDTFVIRRARPIVEGTLFSRVDVRIMPDFGDGRTVLQDAYLDLRFSPKAVLRAGKFKAPVGLERLQSATDLLFVERGLPTNLAPNRDIGVQLQGQLAGNRVQYAVGVFNGVADGSSSDADTGDDKELAARVWLEPWVQEKGSPLERLGFGLAASSGKQGGVASASGLAGYRSASQATVFAYRNDNTATGSTLADGERFRLSPQLTWYYGSFGLLAEGVRASHEVRRGAVERKLTHEAWQLASSWAWGGKPTYRGVEPKKPFDPKTRSWGAFEIAARWGQLEVDPDTFPTFADPAAAASEARAWGLGLNWYLTRGVRLMASYEQTEFDAFGTARVRPDEKILFTRFQVSY